MYGIFQEDHFIYYYFIFIIHSMDSIDIVEESLIELDATLEEEGLIPIDVMKLVEILEAITADEIVNNFHNLISDPSALSHTILKVHYVKEVDPNRITCLFFTLQSCSCSILPLKGSRSPLLISSLS
jgi:hypothetical protein